jgi:putative acetyltransferase
MEIHHEQVEEEKPIRELVARAFESNAEADLVDALRKSGCDFLSLVAIDGTTIIGHILFTPVILEGDAELKMLGLAPLSVLPESQGTGVGTLLTKKGLIECKNLGVDAVVVLGAPEYYGRFGFTPAANFGIKSVYEVKDEYFMLLELNRNSVHGKTGTVRYHEAFSDL